MTPSPDHDSPSGSHRFILLGRTNLVAYHLALFRVPAHAFQMVLAIEFTDQAARTAYLDDLKTQPPPAPSATTPWPPTAPSRSPTSQRAREHPSQRWSNVYWSTRAGNAHSRN